MSYVNKDQFAIVTRRHPVNHLAPEQAIQELNSVVDKANAQIAISEAKALQWFGIAQELNLENERLTRQVVELEAKVKRLEKRLKPKAGKNKGRDIWEGEDE